MNYLKRHPVLAIIVITLVALTLIALYLSIGTASGGNQLAPLNG